MIEEEFTWRINLMLVSTVTILAKSKKPQEGFWEGIEYKTSEYIKSLYVTNVIKRFKQRR